MGKAWRHFKTVTYHKYLVAQGCFRVGLYRQGILHDLSKYSPAEFAVGMRYYQGTRSPNDAEREALGYSGAWLHHKGRNKHHFEYWVDYSKHAKPGEMVPVPMPDRYIAEMIMDRIAACKVYKGRDYTDASPYEYYLKGANRHCMHEYTRSVLERMLKMLAEEGEEKTFRRIKRELVQGHSQRRSVSGKAAGNGRRTGNNPRPENTIQ
ncbi:MAG: DUF5662 family protein [Clostridium sp.]|nr:DUF5662 family protein [Acetatifactor muris]MCM1527145.1 DUF5662 family protein [Bacteroides sp.]MCM1563460.1 DUF5662 family protein [Clostridium sp.]